MTSVIIGRVIVELHGLRRSEAHLWHDKVSRWADTELARHIEAALEDLDPTDHLSLPVVEVDAGRSRATNLETVLGERVDASLREQVGAAARMPRPGATRPGDGGDAPARREDARRIPARERALELVGAFLRSGVLPWWAPADWRLPAAVDASLGDPRSDLPALLRSLASHPHALRRLVAHLREAQCERLLERVRPGLALWLGRWRRLPGVSRDTRGVQAVIEALLRRVCAPGAAMRDEALEGTGLLEQVLHDLDALDVRAGDPATARRAVDDAARADAGGTDPPAAWLAVWQAAIAASASGDGPRSAPIRDAAPAARGRDLPSPRARARGAASSPSMAGANASSPVARSGAATETAAAPEVLAEPVAVRQAGLVLLWPYLSAFLEALDLRRGGAFRDGAQHRAVHLLHYAATGEAGAPEHELLLPKLLCGVDPAVPVSPVFEIDARERAEVEELLGSAIEHWNALGATSVQGLRSSFLHRRGDLVPGDGWLLRVERRGYDVLLERLPYGISMVALSWMNTVLRTEW